MGSIERHAYGNSLVGNTSWTLTGGRPRASPSERGLANSAHMSKTRCALFGSCRRSSLPLLGRIDNAERPSTRADSGFSSLPLTTSLALASRLQDGSGQTRRTQGELHDSLQRTTELTYPPLPPQKDKQGETSATTSGAGSGDASNIPMRDLLNMEDFMTSIDEVRTQIEQLRRSTTLLRDSHARALAASSSATVGPEQLGTADAQRLSQETGALANEVRGRIVGLAGDNRRAGGGGEGFEARKKQLEGVQSAFKGALEELFQVEKEARGKARERIERQYRMGELPSAEAEDGES